MKKDILSSIIKVNENLIIPGVVVKNINSLNLNIEEFILMMYFINQKESITLDIAKISTAVNIDGTKVFDLINSLNEKNYISIETKKNNGIFEEFITTELFYNKLSSLLLDQEKEKTDSNIYSVFEREFGRQLSPIECENIDKWIENGITEELIREALKEAVLSNVKQIRYIDKILQNWTSQGYKSPQDIKRNKESKEEVIEEIYDYDWLNE